MVAAVAVLSSFVFATLKPDAGAEMSGHRAALPQNSSTGMGDGLDAR
jgi:hypothetical protein